MAQTLYDKIWRDHLVTEREDGTGLIYIDRHLLHEVTSPQAFDGLKLAGRRPWRIDANLATPDHNVPTTGRELGIDGITDETSRIQVVTLDDNCRDFGIEQFDIRDVRQGIVHVVGPEQGATLPGMTIVCGDSHTSTHGAFGASGARHRDFGSRACTRHAMPGSTQNRQHGNPHGRHVGPRAVCQGPRARDHRADRHRGWNRTNAGISRTRDSKRCRWKGA